MNRITILTTIILALLVNANTLASTTEDTTDIQQSILQSLSQHYQDYLGYQSSSVEMYRNYRTSRKTLNSPELHFLGGDYFNHDIIVNGLSFRNPLTGVTDQSFASSFFNNINIYQGNIPVNFSNTNSAVIELASPKIFNGFHGSFEALSDNFAGNSFDQNYYRGIFSGSLFENNNLRFWSAFERKWLGDRMPSSLTSDVLDGSPDILPNNQLSGWTYHGKLQYELSAKSLFTITADGSTDEWQEYQHFFNNPSQPGQINHTPRYKDETYGLNALFEQKISENTEFNLSFGYYKSEQIKGDGVVFDNYDAYNRGVYNPRTDVNNLFYEGDSLYVTVIDSITNPANPDTSVVLSEFREAYYDDYVHHISTYKQLRGELNHTVNHHTFNTGFLYKKNSLRYFRDMTPSQGYVRQNINRYGFDSLGVESDNESWKNNTKEPTELSLYLSDKIKINNITLNLGVRYDRYDYKALQIKSPERPFDPDNLDPADITLDESDMVKTETKTNFNPNIGLDFQATETVNLYFNWSQNYQIVPYGSMYVGYDFVEARIASGSFFVISNPSIDPVKSETIILGLKSKITKFVTFGVIVTDVNNTQTVKASTQSPAFPFQYDTYGNINSSSYFGYNLNLQYDNRKNFGFFIDATTSSATSSNQTFNNIAWKNSSGTPAPELPLDYDRTYKIVTGAAYKTEFGLKLNLIAKQEAGSPYTPTLVYDAMTFASVAQFPTGEVNSTETDNIRVLDLKIEKDFKFSNFTINAFILVKNLLNEEIITGVYSGTGLPTSTGYLESPEGIARSESAFGGAEFNSRYKLAQNNPLNFYNPRQIFFGIKTSF